MVCHLQSAFLNCISHSFILDIVLDMGGYDIEQEFFEPLNGLLNRCKSAKTLSRSAFGAYQSYRDDVSSVFCLGE